MSKVVKVLRMMNIALRSWSYSIFTRCKNDAKELRLRKRVSAWKYVQEKRGKHVNVWIEAVSIIIVILVGILAFLLALPMFAGIIEIVFQEASPDTVPSVSQEALIGLIFVSAALGAFIVWFTRDTSKTGKRMLSYIGKLFLFAALAFSLFMLLSPLLPDIRANTDLYSNFLKYVTAISFMAGSAAFVVADVLGLVYLWRF